MGNDQHQYVHRHTEENFSVLRHINAAALSCHIGSGVNKQQCMLMGIISMFLQGNPFYALLSRTKTLYSFGPCSTSLSQGTVQCDNTTTMYVLRGKNDDDGQSPWTNIVLICPFVSYCSIHYIFIRYLTPYRFL